MTTFTISPAISEAKYTPAWIKAERYNYCDTAVSGKSSKAGKALLSLFVRKEIH